MGSFVNFIFAIIFFILWIVAGGFITQANVKLSSYKNTDDYLHNAYWYTFWAAFVTWFLTGAAIIVAILAAIGVVGFAVVGTAGAVIAAPELAAGAAALAPEAAAAAAEAAPEALEVSSQGTKALPSALKYGKKGVKAGISVTTIILLLIGLGLVMLTGILAALAAGQIGQSPNYNSSNSDLKKAYDDCITTTVLTLGTSGLFIIGLITYIVMANNRKKKIKGKQEEKIKEQQILSGPPIQNTQRILSGPSIQNTQQIISRPPVQSVQSQLTNYAGNYINNQADVLMKQLKNVDWNKYLSMLLK